MSDVTSYSATLQGPEATHLFGRALGAACRGGERIALRGELGAGKTSFARGLAAGLGIDPAKVSSPTFTIIHEHLGRSGIRLVHVDAYRLGDADELHALGWEEFQADPRTVIALEWPERASEAFVDPHLELTLEHAVSESSPEEGARFVSCSFASHGMHLHTATMSRCPSCGASIDVAHSSHPFCSKRCRMADLENWFSGRYVVSREIEEDDLMDPELS